MPDKGRCTKKNPAQISILVVDDEPLVLNAMVQLLITLGYQAHTAATIEEACGQLAERRFEAVLLDHHLRGENGFDAVTALRATAANHLTMIGMTGSGMLENAAEYDLDGCLSKPFSMDRLCQILQR